MFSGRKHLSRFCFVKVIFKQLIKLHEIWRFVTGNNISQRHHHVNRKKEENEELELFATLKDNHDQGCEKIIK